MINLKKISSLAKNGRIKIKKALKQAYSRRGGMREIELTGAFFTRENPVGFYLDTEKEQGESFCVAIGENHAIWFERLKKGTILNITGLPFEDLSFSTYGYLYKMTSITQITDDMPIVNLKDVLVSPRFCVEKLNIPLPPEKPMRLLRRLKFFLSSHIFLAHIIYCNLFLLGYRMSTHYIHHYL